MLPKGACGRDLANVPRNNTRGGVLQHNSLHWWRSTDIWLCHCQVCGCPVLSFLANVATWNQRSFTLHPKRCFLEEHRNCVMILMFISFSHNGAPPNDPSTTFLHCHVMPSVDPSSNLLGSKSELPKQLSNRPSSLQVAPRVHRHVLFATGSEWDGQSDGNFPMKRCGYLRGFCCKCRGNSYAEKRLMGIVRLHVYFGRVLGVFLW